jgi:hypothetical protein
MRLHRDLLLFGVLAAAALAGGWWLLSHKPGGAVDAWKQGADARARVGAATPAPAEAFRARLCDAGACVLVEAGGLAFLFGAGEGASESLRAHGLVRADVDLVLLPDLDLQSVAGLPGIARAARLRGRSETLKVNGPDGLVAIVDGANLLASSDQAVRLAVGRDGLDEGMAGRVVFDSGVVTIRVFRSVDGRGRAYRVDFDEKSLVLAGCRAGPETIQAAIRGGKTAAAILSSSSTELAPGEQRCADVAEILKVAVQGKLSAALIVPDSAKEAREAWRELIGASAEAGTRLGVGGMELDLTGEKPVIRD